MGQNYFLLSALPALDGLGSVPPLNMTQLFSMAGESNAHLASALEILFLSNDLLQREALLSGEIKEADLVVLTPLQAKGQAPLPDFLIKEKTETTISRKVPVDDVWEAYFRKTAAFASKGSFLGSWVRYEVGLRNACASARAKALELDEKDYMVAPDLSTGDENFRAVLNEWSAASTPLDGLKVLDSARWAWIQDNDEYFTFKDDEIVGYGARLMLLHRWHRLAEAQADGSSAEEKENISENV